MKRKPFRQRRPYRRRIVWDWRKVRFCKVMLPVQIDDGILRDPAKMEHLVRTIDLWRGLPNGQYYRTFMEENGRPIIEGFYRSDFTPVGTALVRRTP